jgi:protein-arginine kinase activator protein McsA
MSSTERHSRSKSSRHLCAACQERKARFKYRRVVRADRDHTLCFACYRGEVNRARARRLAQAVTPQSTNSALGSMRIGGRGHDERQLAHRQRMLDHLQRTPAVAS